MSKKRKAKPRQPTGYVQGIPMNTVSGEQGKKIQTEVIDAPVLELPAISPPDEHGTILEVDKIGFLGAPSSLLFGGGVAYLETTDSEIYRLPSELTQWAIDLVSLVLAAGGRKSGIFPTKIEFGSHNGRAYANKLD